MTSDPTKAVVAGKDDSHIPTPPTNGGDGYIVNPPFPYVPEEDDDNGLFPLFPITVGRKATPAVAEKPTTEVKVDKKAMLEKELHYAYLFGYPEGDFRPNNSMTRAEVTAMFARLLVGTNDVATSYPQKFSDVPVNSWYSTVVGYMSEKGLISGYPDGTFRPNEQITRAEFAALAARFENLQSGGKEFSDVPKTHWAYGVIASASERGWVNGYPDGTFQPNKAITRAEVTKVTNALLNRKADEHFVNTNSSKMIHFTDVQPGFWAYYDISEATNGHDYTRAANGVDEIWSDKAFQFGK